MFACEAVTAPGRGAPACDGGCIFFSSALNLPVAAVHWGSGARSTNTLLTSVACGSNSSAVSGMESASVGGGSGSGAGGSGSGGGWGGMGCESVGEATPTLEALRSSDSRASALNTFEQRPQRTNPCATRRSAAVTTSVKAHLGQTVYMNGVVPKDRANLRAGRNNPYQNTHCKRVSPRTPPAGEGRRAR